MAFWWVNHKQTRDHEVRGGYLWSPMRNVNGAFNQTYENMRLVRPGDIVFSYAHGEVGAIGRVTEGATACPKPDEFGSIGGYWSREGWMVEVDFEPAPRPLRPRQEIEAIGPLLPSKYSPLQKSGKGSENCYLASISDALGHLLLALTGAEQIADGDLGPAIEADENTHPDVLEDIHRIEDDDSLTVTQRLQLAKARVGQGLFRKRVIVLDGACRVTGVTDTRVLVASHIKPWREAGNADRLNGNNGILLSPHVDALLMRIFSASRTTVRCWCTPPCHPKSCIAGRSIQPNASSRFGMNNGCSSHVIASCSLKRCADCQKLSPTPLLHAEIRTPSAALSQRPVAAKAGRSAF